MLLRSRGSLREADLPPVRLVVGDAADLRALLNYREDGNRRLNKCLYTIAITQARADTEGLAHYLRKREAGKTSKEASAA